MPSSYWNYWNRAETDELLDPDSIDPVVLFCDEPPLEMQGMVGQQGSIPYDEAVEMLTERVGDEILGGLDAISAVARSASLLSHWFNQEHQVGVGDIFQAFEAAHCMSPEDYGTSFGQYRRP